jgi:hypothetical protein
MISVRCEDNARSSDPKNITVNIMKIGGNWPVYGAVNLDINNDMKTYSFKFIMKKPTDEKARLNFDLADSTGDMWISNVRVEELPQ